MRLIDADALSKELGGWVYDTNPEELNEADRAIIDCIIMLNDAPTVDAVAVVRCRECKNCSKIANSATMWHCWNLRGKSDGSGFSVVAVDGYCDEGERKEAADAV